MPKFDFQCRNCSHVFEFARPFGSDENPTCPDCGNTETEKMIALPAIHFKGEGFYKTDSVKPKKDKKTIKEKKDKSEKGASGGEPQDKASKK